MYYVECIMQEDKKQVIKSFTDLNAWKEGHRLVLMIYRTTKGFPQSDRYELTSQVQRAAISITSNIAEGFSRNSDREKIQFYYMALGSLTEVQNHLLIAKDLEFISNSVFQELATQTVIVSKLVNGLIKSLKMRNT